MHRGRIMAAGLTMLAAAQSAQACAVCMGNVESPAVKGAAAGVLFMLVLTYGLLICGFGGIATVWFVRARRLKIAQQQTTDGFASTRPTPPRPTSQAASPRPAPFDEASPHA